MEPASLVVAPGNTDMAAAWNGADGEHWVRWAALYDRAVGRHHQQFLAAAQIGATDQVLDVGCGSGQTTRDAARAAAAGGAVGIDLSAPLVENARRLAADQGVHNATFVRGDAQVHRFRGASFDVAISRTGAMFFADPVAAFTNIGSALRPGARVALLVWQSPAANEWISEILRVLSAGRPIASPSPGAPGPFSMADPQAVRDTLGQAGMEQIELVGRHAPMYLGRDTDEAYRFVITLGLARSMLGSLSTLDRAHVLDDLRQCLTAHATADGVLLDSATWTVTATTRAEN